MKHLLIRTQRDSYGIEDIKGMTVGELIDKLKQFDQNLIVAFTNDRMYCSVNEKYFNWNEYDAFIEVNR